MLGCASTSLLGYRGPNVRLSELLGADVVDENGRDLGKIKDVRFRETAPVVPMTGQVSWEMVGLVVGGAGFAQRLGYLHGDVKGPWILLAVMRWIGRRGHFVPWTRISQMAEARITVRGSAEDLDHPFFDREGPGD